MTIDELRKQVREQGNATCAVVRNLLAVAEQEVVAARNEQDSAWYYRWVYVSHFLRAHVETMEAMSAALAERLDAVEHEVMWPMVEMERQRTGGADTATPP